MEGPWAHGSDCRFTEKEMGKRVLGCSLWWRLCFLELRLTGDPMYAGGRETAVSLGQPLRMQRFMLPVESVQYPDGHCAHRQNQPKQGLAELGYTFLNEKLC